MPPQIGNFIAQTVYPNLSEESDAEPLLKSSEHHSLADAESLLCHFVNVPGNQVSSQDTSWQVSVLFVISHFILTLLLSECGGVQGYYPACYYVSSPGEEV